MNERLSNELTDHEIPISIGIFTEVIVFCSNMTWSLVICMRQHCFGDVSLAVATDFASRMSHRRKYNVRKLQNNKTRDKSSQSSDTPTVVTPKESTWKRHYFGNSLPIIDGANNVTTTFFECMIISHFPTNHLENSCQVVCLLSSPGNNSFWGHLSAFWKRRTSPRVCFICRVIHSVKHWR